MKRFRKSEKGQGLVEYGLILALVSVVAVAGLKGVGGKVNATFEQVVDGSGVVGGEVAPEPAEDYSQYLAEDSDFSGTADGAFKYIGNQEVVYIPHKIKGVEVTSYYQMFRDVDDSKVKKVISDNPNVTNMGYMFYGSKATILDLSSFDTSKVTNMGAMFLSSRATGLDLSSFDTSQVTDMSNMFRDFQATSLDLSFFDTSQVTNMQHMFWGSRATSGYARTQTDANRLNSSSNKPSSLKFIVK